ncbi:hypothetical protein ACH4OQ_21520 [Streptomyces luteogriseus]|uniref:hypothetical protein n=1 Tax=Streptomyces luteogriseus TaxID=68233 RepID=UPI0037AB08FB
MFCLSHSQRANVVEAARNLSLVESPSTPTAMRTDGKEYAGSRAIEDWRKRHPRDFGKACSALIEASSITKGNLPKESSKLDFLNWLLPIVAGSILTLLATELQGVRARRMAAADSIRTTTAAFRDTLIDYTTEWTQRTTGAEPDTAQLDKQKTQLIAALRKARLGRSWPFLDQLTDYIDSPRFRDTLTSGWHGTSAERHRKSGEIRSHMTRLEADTEQVATMSTSTFPLFLRPGSKKAPASVANQ